MEISCTILAASVLIYCIHSKYSLLTLMHSLKVLSFDTDAVLQASKSVGKCLPVVFFGDCFQLWNHHFGKVLDTISFPSVSCLARKKRAKLKGARSGLRSGLYGGWRKNLKIFCPSHYQVTAPCIVGTGTVVEKEDVLVVVTGCWLLISWATLSKTVSV